MTGPALDWAVAKCEGYKPYYINGRLRPVFRTGMDVESTWPSYTSDWAQGGPIIDREDIDVLRDEQEFGARLGRARLHPTRNALSYFVMRGPTKLIAAMRCLVASKLGDEVDVPQELS